jgi:hypothetical protein
MCTLVHQVREREQEKWYHDKKVRKKEKKKKRKRRIKS